jgi:hypothetical protein
MEANPFLVPPVSNPFMTTDQNVSAALAAQTPCGDASCRRSHRPGSGEHYSSDPSIRAQQLMDEGKIGPHHAHLGGAKSKHKRRATEIVAEAAAEAAEEIKQVFIDGIDTNNPIGIRLQAAKDFLKVEGEDIEREMRERQAEFDQMNKEQLVGEISGMIERLNRAGAIAGEVAQMIDGDSEDITDVDVIS